MIAKLEKERGDIRNRLLWLVIVILVVSITVLLFAMVGLSHVFRSAQVRDVEVADRLSRILIERARAGVDVFFLHDAFGTRDLRASGVHVAEFSRRSHSQRLLESAANAVARRL